jgi:beta-lactamase class A
MHLASVLLLGVLLSPVMPAHAAAPGAAPAGHGDVLRPRLEQRLEAIATRLDGELGYCIIDLTSGERLARLGTRPFPTASTIKIAVLYELFAQAEEQRLRLDDARPLPDAARAAGSGVLQHLESPVLPLTDYATLMIMLSDNSATNILIDAVGMDAVNRRMRGLGLEQTWLQRRMIDTEAARAGRENLASPCDIARLLEAIHAGKGISASSQAGMLAILRKPKSTPFTRAIPAGIPVASKPGGLDGVSVDAALVALPGRPYIVVGMASWLQPGTEGSAALEALARETHGYFSRLARGGQYGRMVD